ncbi:hypothetical protein FGIG_04397 [Fasciola gigantica]|uniref:Uncharacterized protein n=1 Tax=Fasciola gigantica TaxID=46835 RepID=A0A504YTW3_FASGI|nr:hypothetical protein FGIG_04397 [Fasciola gigantica]
MPDCRSISCPRPPTVRWMNNTEETQGASPPPNSASCVNNWTGTPLSRLISSVMSANFASHPPKPLPRKDVFTTPRMSLASKMYVRRHLRQRSMEAREALLQTMPQPPSVIEKSSCLHAMSLDTLRRTSVERNRSLSPYFRS